MGAGGYLVSDLREPRARFSTTGTLQQNGMVAWGRDLMRSRERHTQGVERGRRPGEGELKDITTSRLQFCKSTPCPPTVE